MGTFFGSVHVRTTDRSAVGKAAETVAARHRIKFFLAPAIDGWTTLFPCGHGQDDKPARDLAAALPNFDIFHVVLHDDDIFAYNFFRNGRLFDEYSSSPDYFQRVSEEERDRQRGRPERYADILGTTLPALDSLLHRSTCDASAQFERFAQLLHLPNAATSFEYLEDNERDGIRRFAEFLQIPDPAAEKAATLQQRTAVAAALKSAKAEGLFLAEYIGGKDGRFVRYPVLSPVGQFDFLLAWGCNFSREPTTIFRLMPPYPKTAKSVGAQIDCRFHSLSAGASGRRALIGFASGRWEFELWDLPEARKIATHPHPFHAISVQALSRDESFFALRSTDVLHLVDASDGIIRRRWHVPGQGQIVALHPSMRWAVVDTHIAQPAIIDLQSDALPKRLFIAGKYDLTEDSRRQILLRMAVASDREKALWQVQLDNLSNDSFTFPHQEDRGQEALRAVDFSADGAWLLLATNHGARAYRWQAVLDAPADHAMPAPIFAAEAEPITYELRPGHLHYDAITNAVAFDRWSNSMLFTGLEGTVRSLNLQTGEHRTLFEIPGRPPITCMDLSFDHTLIALRFKPVHFERSPKTPWHVQLWRNPAAKL
jgi:hypothetical protein